MFLIDHDQTKVAERQEQRRPRADHQLRLTLPHHAPDAAAFGHGDARMPFGGLCAKPRLDPVQELFGQRDFRQQHQRLPPCAQRGGDRLEIDLGLARSGDTAQQRGAVGARSHTSRPARAEARLIVGQLLAGQVGVHPRKGTIARAVLFDHGALLHQPLDDRGRDPGHLGQFLEREGQIAVLRQHLQHAAAGVGHPLGVGRAAPVDLAHRRRIAQPRRAGRQPQHRGHRRQRIGSGRGQERLAFPRASVPRPARG